MLAGGKIDPAAFLANLVPVTLGNIVGGAGLVALVYWVAYVRSAEPR
jgi:formate/nitrite transporter FocA (FNT family)